jgi:hypothetical protein
VAELAIIWDVDTDISLAAHNVDDARAQQVRNLRVRRKPAARVGFHSPRQRFGAL